MSELDAMLDELKWLEECDALFPHDRSADVSELADDDGEEVNLDDEVDHNRAVQCLDHRNTLYCLLFV
jgi:hypothetical protein